MGQKWQVTKRKRCTPLWVTDYNLPLKSVLLATYPNTSSLIIVMISYRALSLIEMLYIPRQQRCPDMYKLPYIYIYIYIYIYMHQWTGSALVQVMAYRLFGTKPSPKPMLTYYPLDMRGSVQHSQYHGCWCPSWLLTSPGHQHPWYWLCIIGKFLSYLRKNFNYLCHVNVVEWHKMWIYLLFPLKDLAHGWHFPDIFKYFF